MSEVVTDVILTFLHHSSIPGLLLNSEMCLLVTELENTRPLTGISLSHCRLQFPGACRGSRTYKINDKTRKWVKLFIHMRKKGNDVLSWKNTDTSTNLQMHTHTKKDLTELNECIVWQSHTGGHIRLPSVSGASSCTVVPSLTEAKSTWLRHHSAHPPHLLASGGLFAEFCFYSQ